MGTHFMSVTAKNASPTDRETAALAESRMQASVSDLVPEECAEPGCDSDSAPHEALCRRHMTVSCY